MAFDGITIANIVYDLNRTILNGRIAKIAQPEKDESDTYQSREETSDRHVFCSPLPHLFR